jgi:hypothetical protein
MSMETPNSTGFTLFPNQTADTAFGIDDAPITNFTTAPTTKPVAAFVPVCTIYRFKGDGGIFHYTPAAYILVTPTPSGPVNVDIVHMPVGGVAVEIRPLAQSNLDPT